MEPRRILIAVTGGIAAYKVPELVRALRRDGHSVRCAMTREASHFVSPLVLQTLTAEPVRSELLDLVVVDGDPLAFDGFRERIRAVYQAGQLVAGGI